MKSGMIHTHTHESNLMQQFSYKTVPSIYKFICSKCLLSSHHDFYDRYYKFAAYLTCCSLQAINLVECNPNLILQQVII
ncbi:hypothetical protein BRADI_3g25996v3 [Brachypodium distachyon]|uniref:Uncharacterized protein n=1 Tax=Brachypodium distachyon TaxID=15368 RepID=A0A0Q3FA01_BRADI|nr:hypothetical protein BRADI_3g25996v3 [Brachypodium distachyon]